MLSSGNSAWVSKQDSLTSSLRLERLDLDGYCRCRECGRHNQRGQQAKLLESAIAARFINYVLRPCIKYFTLQGRDESEKMWQFAKGKGMKITCDVSHSYFDFFYYAYKI